MDETPLYFDMPGLQTVHPKGCREVHIRSTGAEKHRLTVILTCTAAGDIFSPMLIFRGKRALKKLCLPTGVIVAVQKQAWNDSTLTKMWIQKVLCQYTKKRNALLVWDTFSGHMTEEVIEELQKRNITVATIPGGCTSKVQPPDVSLNKPFKSSCRNHWVRYMQQQVSQVPAGERLKLATKQVVIDWGVQSNRLLNTKKEIICKSFLVCGISNALGGSQNQFIRCAKELPNLSIAYGLTTDPGTDSGTESDPFASESEEDSADSPRS